MREARSVTPGPAPCLLPDTAASGSAEGPMPGDDFSGDQIWEASIFTCPLGGCCATCFPGPFVLACHTHIDNLKQV